MAYYLPWLSNTAAPPPAPPAGATQSQLGINLARPDYYRANSPFLNMIHSGYQGWIGNQTYVTSSGWLSNVPNGTTLTKLVIFDATYPVGVLRTGRYVVKWTGDATITLQSCSLHSNISTSANRIEFDMAQMTLATNRTNALALDATNGSVTNCYVGLLSEESLWDSGKVASPTFATIYRNARCVRIMHQMQVLAEQATDYPLSSHCSWYLGIPPDVAAKWAHETGIQQLWLTRPHLYSHSKWIDWCNAFAAARTSLGATFTVVMEFSNECWQDDSYFYPQGVWLENTYSAGLTIVDDNGNPSSSGPAKRGCAYADMALRTWKAMEDAIGASNVVCVYGGFYANISALRSGLEYTDPGIISAGTKVKDICITRRDAGRFAFCIAPYFGAHEGGGGSYPSDMTGMAQAKRQDDLETNAWWDGLMRQAIEALNPRVTDWITSWRAKVPNALVWEYEGGQHTNYDLSREQGLPATIVNASNVLRFGEDVSAWINDGDSISYSYDLPHLFSGSFHDAPWLVRRINTTDVRLYASQADYDSNTPATLATSTGTTYKITLWSRLLAICDRYEGLLDSAYGVEWFSRYYNKLRESGVTLYNQFVAAGRETFRNSGGVNGAFFGHLRSPWDSQNVYRLAAWYNQLGLGSPLTTRRVFITGHSLTDVPMGTHLETIANSISGCSVEWQQQIGVGSPLRARTDGSTHGAYVWTGFQTGLRKDGSSYSSGSTALQEVLNNTSVSAPYTDLVIAERHDWIGTLYWETFDIYCKALHDRVAASVPGIQTWHYHTWLDINDKANPAAWITFLRQSTKAWEAATHRINMSLHREQSPRLIRNIAMCDALARLTELSTGGNNLAGITGANDTATMNNILADNVHPTGGIGFYYVACVLFSSIYRRSCVGAAYPTSGPNQITAQQAASLQQTAWDWVQSYYASEAPLTLSEARTQIQGTLGAAYDSWRSENNTFARNQIGTNSNVSPFFFNNLTGSGNSEAKWVTIP